MKCLICLDLYKITSSEIKEIRDKQETERHLFKWLPEYYIKPDGNVVSADYYTQYTEEGDDLHYMFNATFTEEPLAEEIANLGLEELQTYYDINWLFLKDICKLSYKDMHHSLNQSTFVVMGLKYDTYYTVEGGREVDCDIWIEGYLNDEKELVKLK